MFLTFISYFVLFIVGYIGYKVFQCIHSPTPALLGPLFLYSVCNISGYLPEFSIFWVNVLGQILLGIILSNRFTRFALSAMSRVFVPVCVSILGIFILSIICSFILYEVGHLSISSSLLASAAGGLPEMLALGISLDAEITAIVFFQIARVILVMLFVPLYLRKSKRNVENHAMIVDTAIRQGTKKEIVFLICIASLIAVIFYFIKVPAPFIFGSLCGSICFAIGRNFTFKPSKKIQNFALACIALVTSTHITYATVLQLPHFLVPLVLTTFVLIFGSLGLAYFLEKITKWDSITCQLACAPGGLSQMAALASELNANVVVVTVLHSIRLISIIIVWTILVRLLN